MLAQNQIRRSATSRAVASRSRAGFYLVLAGLTGAIALDGRPVRTQAGQTGSELRLGIAEIPTPLNKLPDANFQMKLQAQKKAMHRFDAANALRQRQLEDEAARLLQLTRDLQSKVERFGDGPPPEFMVQEAGAIEMLAHDVQARMVLTVGGG